MTHKKKILATFYSSLLLLVILILCDDPPRPDFYAEFELTVFSDSSQKNELKNNTDVLLNDLLEFSIYTNKPMSIKKIEIELKDDSDSVLFTRADSVNLSNSDNKILLNNKYEFIKIGMKTLHYKFSTGTGDTSIQFDLHVKGRPPKLHNENIEIPVTPELNSFFAMYVHADGTKPLEFEWYKNDIKIPNNGVNILTFEKLNKRDLGIYQCIVKNKWETEKSNQYKLELEDNNPEPARPVIDTMKPGIALISPSYTKDTVVEKNYNIKIYAIDKSGIDWVQINDKTADRIEYRFEKKIGLKLGSNEVRIIAQDSSDNKNRDTMDMEIFYRLGPQAVKIYKNVVPEPSSLTITWSKSTDTNFGGYKVYYTERDCVTVNSKMSCVNTDINDTTCTLENLKANKWYKIRVFAFDNKGNSSGSNEISEQTGNSKPVFNPLKLQVGKENEELSFTVRAEDNDEGTKLTYRMLEDSLHRVLKGSAEFNGESGKFLWKPGYDTADPKPYVVIFIVEDNGDPVKTDTLRVDIKIVNTNRPPEFDDATVKDTLDSVYVGQEYLNMVYATDLDGDSVYYSLEPGHFPSGMTIETIKINSINMGIIKWTPSENMGDIDVLVLANDENDGTDEFKLTLKFPIHFKPIYSLRLPLEPQSLVLSDNYAFVPGGVDKANTGGFCIIDITNPDSPNMIDTIIIKNARTFEMVISEDVAFTVSHNTGLQCFDISNISSVSLLSDGIPIEKAESIVKAGDYVYISNKYKGMTIFNVKNPKKIKKIKDYYLNPDFTTRDVEVSDKYAYIITEPEGMCIVDIKSPSDSCIGKYDKTRRVEELVVSGDFAYLAAFEDGFQIIDITDPESPKLIGSSKKYNIPDFDPYRISLYGNYAFLSDWHDYLKIFNISNPSDPKLIYTLEDSFNTERIIIKGDYAYSVGEMTFTIYRIFNF